LNKDPETPVSLTNFRVGKGIGIVAKTTMALFEPVNGLLAQDLWELVLAGSGVDDLLESLSATGLRSLGSFAMVQFEESGMRLVVRGTASIDLLGPEETTIEAQGVRTWVEHFSADVRAVTLRLGEVVDGSLPFAVDLGLLPADLLQRTPSTERPSLDGLEFGWVDQFEAVNLSDLRPQATAPGPSSPIASAGTRLVSSPQLPDVSESVVSGPEEMAVSPVVEDGAPSHFGPGAVAVRPLDDSHTMAAVDLDSAQKQAALAVDLSAAPEYDYDSLYGHTVARSVQGAAVAVPQEHAAAPEIPFSGNAASDLGLQPPSPPMSRMIESIPNALASDLAEPDFFGADGHTMTKSDLAALRQGLSPSPDSPPTVMGGPTVQAVMCPSNHPNPLGAVTCTKCRQPVVGQPTVIGRPRLGQLRLDTGQVIGLDRPLIIGRKPKVEGRMLSEMPHLIELAIGNGLSRSHAMVKLEGWHVLLEDLGSANGTILTLPGQPARRLHEGEPALLEFGSHIELGGEVTAFYEPNP
jgi:FHA domain